MVAFSDLAEVRFFKENIETSLNCLFLFQVELMLASSLAIAPGGELLQPAENGCGLPLGFAQFPPATSQISKLTRVIYDKLELEYLLMITFLWNAGHLYKM